MSEIFKSYEVTRVPYWPKIARILGPSVVFHLLLVLSVLYVPAVRDAVNVVGIFAGAEFVDKEYKKTHIGDDVQIIDLEASDRFRYPDGYFSTGEPLPDPMAPVIVNSPTAMPTPWPTPAPTPTPLPVPVVPPPGINPGPIAKNRRGKNPPGIPDDLTPNPAPSPNPIDGSTAEEANRKADQLAAENGVNRPKDNEINRAPLKDFVNRANDLFEKGQLNFNQPIEVIIDAELDSTAHFTNANVVTKSGNVSMDEISKDMVAALSDSGALRFLMTRDGSSVELKKMRFIIKMDQGSFNAQIESDATSAARAKQLAFIYGLMLGAVPKLREGKEDEIAIAKGTTLKSDGTKLIAIFSMPRQQAIDLMKKQVAANKKPES
ncbi:MAG: hypothetical protein ABIP75_08950 [Pyrinomonadaceae bacterium]